jgi:hypothetical protein
MEAEMRTIETTKPFGESSSMTLFTWSETFDVPVPEALQGDKLAKVEVSARLWVFEGAIHSFASGVQYTYRGRREKSAKSHTFLPTWVGNEMQAKVHMASIDASRWLSDKIFHLGDE